MGKFHKKYHYEQKAEKLTFLSKTKSGSEWWITLPYSCANNAVSASFLHVL